jgi:hypothetical protein
LKTKTTSTEFNDWMLYLELEPNLFHREDYYLAQIAAFIVKANAKKNVAIRLKDFLLKFVPEQKSKPLTKEMRLQQSKQFWFNLVGMNKKRKRRQ